MRQASLLSRFSLSSVALLALSFSAHAATLFVPTSFPTIQEAIDKASNGDTVEIADGIYSGKGNIDLDFQGKAIEVVSASGDPQRTIIDCLGQGRGFHFFNGETPSSRVSGITIRNGLVVGSYLQPFSTVVGAGILCEAASPTIDHCILEGNTATGLPPYGVGGGIGLTNGSDSKISFCTFRGNVAHFGAGIALNASSPIVNGCAFEKNSGIIGAGIFALFCPQLTVIDSQFLQNSGYAFGTNWGDRGPGIYLGASTLTMDRCNFTGNAAQGSGGIYITDNSSANIRNTIFFRNKSSYSGGGAIHCSQSEVQLENCLLIGNSAPRYGGAISITQSPTTSVSRLVNCTLVANAAYAYGSQSGIGGGLFNSGSSTTEVTNCIFFNNVADGYQEIFGPVSMSASLVEGYPGLTNLPNAQGNFTDKPGFVRMPFTNGSRDPGDLHVYGGTPTVDRGWTSLLPTSLITDFDGRARVRFSSVDLGAYEF